MRWIYRQRHRKLSMIWLNEKSKSQKICNSIELEETLFTYTPLHVHAFVNERRRLWKDMSQSVKVAATELLLERVGAGEGVNTRFSFFSLLHYLSCLCILIFF